MNNCDRVTITGADDKTDPAALVGLSAKFPFVEWGILMSPSQQGSPRFPGAAWMRSFGEDSYEAGARVSLHLCGRYVRDILHGGHLVDIEHPLIWSSAARAQLNFHGLPHDLDIPDMISRLSFDEHLQWIVQMDGTVNEDILFRALGSGVNAVPLFDTSGGAGTLPEHWPNSYVTVANRLIYHGYAGGLGPEVIESEFLAIAEAADEARFWIDMEGKVRTNEVLDLEKVETVLVACATWIDAKAEGPTDEVLA